MTARELLDYAIDHDLVFVDIDQTDEDWHGCNDVDLDKGVDKNGYTVDGGLLASMVRNFRKGNVANFDVTLYVYRTPHDYDRDTLATCGQVSNTLNPMLEEDSLDLLAEQAEPQLRELVAAHQRG